MDLSMLHHGHFGWTLLDVGEGGVVSMKKRMMLQWFGLCHTAGQAMVFFGAWKLLEFVSHQMSVASQVE